MLYVLKQQSQKDTSSDHSCNATNPCWFDWGQQAVRCFLKDTCTLFVPQVPCFTVKSCSETVHVYDCTCILIHIKLYVHINVLQYSPDLAHDEKSCASHRSTDGCHFEAGNDHREDQSVQEETC